MHVSIHFGRCGIDATSMNKDGAMKYVTDTETCAPWLLYEVWKQFMFI